MTCLSFVACGELGDLLGKDGDAAGEENVSGGEGTSGEDGDSGNEAKMVVSGYVQKGQFAAGSQVTIFGLDDDLMANGDSWPSNIKDASGSFAVSVAKGAAYMEIRAQGYYFDELSGETSDGIMTLEAIVDQTSDRVNVNLLTHLVRPRIKRLVAEGSTYSQARAQAERELVTTLGYSALDVSFDQLDITRSREGDALLLALACALQCDRTTGEMVTLINALSLDFEEDGTLDESNLAMIETAKSQIDIMQVYENMQEYYSKNNMTEAVVPEFYRYLLDKDLFLVKGAENEEMSFPREGGEGELYVVSMTDFTAESNVEWVEVSKEHMTGPQYKIVLKVLPNETLEDHTGKIIFKDAQGGTRAEYVITQAGAYELIECVIGGGTKSLIMDEGTNILQISGEDMVDVNGEDYSIVGEGDRFTVRVKRASSYVVSYPADAVEAMPDGTYSVNYPSEVRNNTYGVLMGLTDGTACVLELLNALVKADLSNYPDWTHAELRVAEGVAICGEAVVTSDYNVSSVEGGKSVVRVNRCGKESVAYIPVLSCHAFAGFTFTVYYADGKSYSKMSSRSFVLQRKMVMMPFLVGIYHREECEVTSHFTLFFSSSFLKYRYHLTKSLWCSNESPRCSLMWSFR